MAPPLHPCAPFPLVSLCCPRSEAVASDPWWRVSQWVARRGFIGLMEPVGGGYFGGWPGRAGPPLSCTPPPQVWSGNHYLYKCSLHNPSVAGPGRGVP